MSCCLQLIRCGGVQPQTLDVWRISEQRVTARSRRPVRVTALSTQDVRFPTSRTLDGSDAMHASPDYSAAYVVLETDTGVSGHSLVFTAGRGTDVCCLAIDAFAHLVAGRELAEITG